MFRRLSPRVAVGAATVTTLLSAALLTPLAAEAAPVRITCRWDDGAGDYTCKRSCTQTLPDGATVYYDDGTEITITTADGKTTKFKCVDGNWVQQARLVPPTFLGTINMLGSIAGLQGEVEQETCKPEDAECTRSPYFIGPNRSFGGGCDPNRIACP